MGRRKRSREGDELESYERAWLNLRERGSKTTKHRRVNGDDNPEDETTSFGTLDAAPMDNIGKPTQVVASNTSTTNISTTPEQDKTEKQRLKKQRQKERRKEKKAQAAASKESATKHKLELQKAAQSQKQQQLEKKKRSKEKHASQTFRTFPQGVKVLDLSIGKGLMAQHRKKVRVSYTLRANNHNTGKIIDSSKNFPFRLGKGEVIRGWDIGLEGMKVGGVRRLIVPPEAGYGRNKDVGAGRGGDLYFEIELLYVAP